MKWLNNWIKKRADRLIKEEEDNLPSLQRVVSDEAEQFRESKEPWVTIIGDSMSDDGIQIALDWNDAFILYLKKEGITGTDETQVVQKWLAMIAKQTSEKLGDTDGFQ